jgi:hypothetical protein
VSPFQRAFTHYDDCVDCRYADRKLCPIGKVLFDAALRAAEMLASPIPPKAVGEA